MKQFEFPDRIRLANLPTPIEKLDRICVQWGGPQIYVKRDDLTGMALSGNKIRKLEFVIAEARNQGADLLITCGGVQSNHARATAVAAAKLGMACYLVLRGSSDSPIDGNLLLDRLVGARIKFISAEDYSKRVDEIMAELALQLKHDGFHPYIIPEGASNELGCMGYVAAMAEINKQMAELNFVFDHIICATGSGGTQAGLILGKKLFAPDCDVIGFNVCDDEAYFVRKIRHIATMAIERFSIPISLSVGFLIISISFTLPISLTINFS
ncbi:MAG: pyridoxal-phosphate dependent enzyme [candidate division KSB1 bacterium]|nr:pyridoxal-phosphate dependent enzyme [candidate division KSB1 bacterium]